MAFYRATHRRDRLTRADYIEDTAIAVSTVMGGKEATKRVKALRKR